MPPEVNWLHAAGDFIGSAGMPGVVAALLYVIKILWGEITDRNVTIAALQDKRALEAAEAVKTLATAMTASTVHTTANTTALQDGARLQQAGLDILRLLPGAIEGLSRNLDRNYEKIDQLPSRLVSGR